MKKKYLKEIVPEGFQALDLIDKDFNTLNAQRAQGNLGQRTKRKPGK